MHFFFLTPAFWELDVVILSSKIKNYMLMLVYKLLKIAPDGGEFANTTLGLLFGLMEAGLAIWFLVELISNTCF